MYYDVLSIQRENGTWYEIRRVQKYSEKAKSYWHVYYVITTININCHPSGLLIVGNHVLHLLFTINSMVVRKP